MGVVHSWSAGIRLGEKCHVKDIDVAMIVAGMEHYLRIHEEARDVEAAADTAGERVCRVLE